MNRKINLRDLAYASIPSQTGFRPNVTKSIRAVRRADLDKSLSHLGKACQELAKDLTSLSFKHRYFWPENSYIVNHEYKFIFCPIPKNASTTLKRLVLQLEGVDVSLKQDRSRINTHARVNDLTLGRMSLFNSVECLNDPEYFKFTFVRNPWERLVSAFYSKFVKLSPEKQPNFVRHVIENIYSYENALADYKKSISFKQFVEYLARTDDQNLNEHWKPQASFLSNVEFTFIGRMEKFPEDMKYLLEELNIPDEYSLENRNKTKYGLIEKNLSPSELSSLHALEIKERGLYVTYDRFYTSALRNLVRERYGQDIEILHYSF